MQNMPVTQPVVIEYDTGVGIILAGESCKFVRCQRALNARKSVSD
jgi:hypothetical protein